MTPTLVERLRERAVWHDYIGHPRAARDLRAAIARIKAADKLIAAARRVEEFSPFDPRGGLPNGFIYAVNVLNDATRALVREQDGG